MKSKIYAEIPLHDGIKRILELQDGTYQLEVEKNNNIIFVMNEQLLENAIRKLNLIKISN